MSSPAPPPPPGGASDDAALPTNALVMALAARPGERLFRVLEDPGPLRPLLAVLAVLPAVAAAPRCRLDRVDPAWGTACLAAFAGEPLPEAGPAAWLTGRLLAFAGTAAPVAYFALSWAGATLLVWAVWQLAAAAAGPRPAAFAALLTATNPIAAASAATGPPVVAGLAAAVAGAWLWVLADGPVPAPGKTRGAGAARAAALGGGLLTGLAALLAGPSAALGPVCVAVASVLLRLSPGGTRGDDGKPPRRADRWPAVAGRAAVFLLAAAGPALWAAFAGPAAAWGAAGPRPVGALAVGALAVFGLAAVAGGARWLDRPVRAAVLGWSAAAAACLALTAVPAGPDRAPAPAALTALVAAVLAAVVALEGACKPAVNPRTIAALAVLPPAALAAWWVAAGPSPGAAAARAVFVTLVLIGAWGVWQVAAFRWPPAVRGRRLLIGGVLAVAAGGLARSLGGADPGAGRGTAKLVAAVAARPEADLVILAEPADQPAARFLFAAAAPDRRRFVVAPAPRVADLLTRGAAGEGAARRPPLVAVVGGGPAAWLDALRPAGAAPPISAGTLRGRSGGRPADKEVRLLVGPAAEPGD